MVRVRRYDEMLARFHARWGEAFDPSDLDQRFVEHYNSGARIGVVWGEDGERVETGTVSCTTGRKPAFLLMHNTRSMGSSILLQPDYRIVKIKPVGARKYTEVQHAE